MYLSVLVLLIALLAAPSAASASPELSTSDQLNTRRYVAAGDRAYVMGFEDGRFYGQGWHITGEMGGIWSQPLKLVDGVWFGVGSDWLPPATKFTSGWGYTRMAFPETEGLEVSRTDFAPDGHRAALLGLHLHNPGASEKTVAVKVDAHSEVMSHYPWAWTTPNAGDFNLQDTGAFENDALVFHDTGTPHPNAGAHDWVAMVGSNPMPDEGEAGAGHWGPQGPPVLCESEAQFWCDEGPFGKGTGGQLRYTLTIPAGGDRTLWVAVAGSDAGAAAARRELNDVLSDPAAELAAKQASREKSAAYSKVSLPRDQRLADGIDWGKQNLLDLTQRADELKVRDANEGKDYPPSLGTVAHARWFGAGYPDYPWIFATDAEYTGFAAVTVGQFETIKDHARALRDVSVILNGNSGKVVHEVVADGSVYFGDLNHRGNTDETAKFPSLVALIWRWTGDNRFRDDMYSFAQRNMRYVTEQLDDDNDGWPEGLGNVERAGMGDEKLDNAVYTIRGLYDLADMARAKGDDATYDWAIAKAKDLRRRFESTWWYDPADQYADSLINPGNEQSFQKHWIGQTPMEAELTLLGKAWPGLAGFPHGDAALAGREDPCYSGSRPYNLGLFHTGCEGGPEGQGERTIFGLNTAIQAVGEGNYGRLAEDQQKRYTDAEVEPMFGEPYSGGDEVHHTPGTPDEQPGASPEIFPSPDFDAAGPRDANVERCTRCRSMVMQAWNQYGTMWPVIHQQLGVRPDLGRGRLEVVPQVPPYEPSIGGENIRLGDGALAAVQASRDGQRYRTELDTGTAPVSRLYIGHTLPRGARVSAVYLDGSRRGAQVRSTNRGVEVTVNTGPGHHVLEVVAG
ncbi:MAG TPA: hypothetical protein VE570_05175 [Thermoleophilaceae bacterium]|nr:hypothetical protein [Thermoleophilaceae bacterium]